MLRSVNPPKVHPAHMSLYPTMDSTTEAIAYIESQIPINTPNEVFGLLMIYHNSLLKQIAQETPTTH